MLKYKIVLAPFPFADLKTRKYRPLLCLTEPKGKHKEIVLAYMTSNTRNNKLESDVLLQKSDKYFKETGLKIDTCVKLNKLLTLPKEMLVGQLGSLPKNRIGETKKKLSNLFE